MKARKLVLTILFAIFLLLSVILVVSNEVNIALFSGLFTVFLGFMLVQTMKMDSSPTSKYNGMVNNILKTYDVILVEVENLPEISERKVVNTTSFKDMVNIEYEYRKPVYYIHNDNAYDFILLTDEEAYVYTLKNDENISSIFETYMKDKEKSKTSNEKQLDVLDSLENTTVIKLDDDKEYIVSPMSNN